MVHQEQQKLKAELIENQTKFFNSIQNIICNNLPKSNSSPIIMDTHGKERSESCPVQKVQTSTSCSKASYSNNIQPTKNVQFQDKSVPHANLNASSTSTNIMGNNGASLNNFASMVNSCAGLGSSLNGNLCPNGNDANAMICNNIGNFFDATYGTSFERSLYEVSIANQRRFALLHPWVYQLSFVCPKSEVITKMTQLSNYEILRSIARFTAANISKPNECQRILLLNYAISKINFPMDEVDQTFKNLINNIDIAIQSGAKYTTQDIDNSYTTMKLDMKTGPVNSTGQHSFRYQNSGKSSHLCIDYQRGQCQRKENCRYIYRCENCKTFGHGSSTCRKPKNIGQNE